MTPDQKLTIINSWVDVFDIIPSAGERGKRYIGKIMMNRISVYHQYTRFGRTEQDVIESVYDSLRDAVWEYVYRWVK